MAHSLPAYSGRNFYLQAETEEEFVLKIFAPDVCPEDIDLQHRVLDTLAQRDTPDAYPRPCKTLSGEQSGVVVGPDGHSRLTQLRTYLPGVLLIDTVPHHPDLLRSLGRFLGRLNQALLDFAHPAMHRESDWDLKNAATIVGRYLGYISSPVKRALAQHFLTRVERNVLPALPELGTSVIHNDANTRNVLVVETPHSPTRVSGIFDFEDIVHTHTVFELAIAIAYVILDKEAPLSVASHVAAGYHAIRPLTEGEWAVLYDAICARLCVSVCKSAYHGKLEPENDYIRIWEQPAWDALFQLVEVSPDELTRLRDLGSQP